MTIAKRITKRREELDPTYLLAGDGKSFGLCNDY